MSLFKIKSNILFIGNEEVFSLPKELHNLEHKKIYATATCGLISFQGAYVGNNKALLQDGRTVEGRCFNQIDVGLAVYVREHINIYDKQSFIFSRRPLTNQLNYITIEYKDFKLRVDPFSKEYAIYT